jgi:hypothetical protein
MLAAGVMIALWKLPPLARSCDNATKRHSEVARQNAFVALADEKGAAGSAGGKQSRPHSGPGWGWGEGEDRVRKTFIADCIHPAPKRFPGIAPVCPALLRTCGLNAHTESHA